MNATDIVFALMLLTFFPFNEGIVAKSPRWQRLSSRIEKGVIGVIHCRAETEISADIAALARHFKRLTVLTLALMVGSWFLGRQSFIIYVFYLFMFCLFSWISLQWTFMHESYLASFSYTKFIGLMTALVIAAFAVSILNEKIAAILLYSILWPFDFVRTALGNGEVMRHVGKLLALMLAVPIYYLLGWILLPPFALCVLVGLKASKSLAALLRSRVGKSLIYEISVTVQLFGTIYLFWAGRPDG